MQILSRSITQKLSDELSERYIRRDHDNFKRRQFNWSFNLDNSAFISVLPGKERNRI